MYGVLTEWKGGNGCLRRNICYGLVTNRKTKHGRIKSSLLFQIKSLYHCSFIAGVCNGQE